MVGVEKVDGAIVEAVRVAELDEDRRERGVASEGCERRRGALGATRVLNSS